MGLLASTATTLASAGYVVVFFISMAESGLGLGFFLPGDTMLIAIGVLASQGYLDLDAMMAAAFAGAILGDTIAYSLGRRFGPRIFSRERSFVFAAAQVERAKKFYERHGGKTVIIARFLPVVRTVAPIFAGVGRMPYFSFFAFNVLGAFLWATVVPLAGYLVGGSVASVHNVLVAVLGIAAVILLFPAALQILLDKDRRARLFTAARKLFLGLIRRPRC